MQVDDDDAWSYTFPASTDLLPLDPSKDVDIPSDEKGDDFNGHDTKSDLEILNEHLQQVESKYKSDGDSMSKTSTNSSLPHSLSSPFLQKSGPANPHTTREDANSIISRESQKNALANLDFSHEDNLMDRLADSPSQRSSGVFKSNSNATINLENHKRNATELEINLEKSPKIITYRRSRRTTSEGNFQETLSSALPSPKDKFDPKLYVEDRYRDTNYRYATIKRNTDFHQLFRSLDLTDRLLDDFACALSREILLQGRIYISEHYVCFNSSLLGWVTNLVIPQTDITRFEKKSTAGIFPNGILIETKDASHTFASFISRDSTLDFMIAVWEGATGKKMVLEDDKKSDQTDDTDSQIESYIMSLDGDSGDKIIEQSEVIDNDELVDSDDPIEDTTFTKVPVVRFKEDSGYKSQGPEIHSPTEIDDPYSDLEENEIELCCETIDAPLGVVYEIMFGPNNTKFFEGYLETHGSSDLTNFGDFKPLETNHSKSHRQYTYKKSLGYSIGPKSTTCEVEEIIQAFDLEKFVVVESITKTPDVPLGNSFFVKTRFKFNWAAGNKTCFRLSYMIEWTGRSWIRGVIEKLTLSGQTDGCKELLLVLREEISKATTTETTEARKEEIQEFVEPKAEEIKESTAESHTITLDAFLTKNITGIFGVAFILLAIIIILQIIIMIRLSELAAIVEKGSAIM